MNEVPVPKGTFVVVNIQSRNVNKELWGEDACEWRLERGRKAFPSKCKMLAFQGSTRICQSCPSYHALRYLLARRQTNLFRRHTVLHVSRTRSLRKFDCH